MSIPGKDKDIQELPTYDTYFACRFHSRNYSTRYDRVIFNPIIKCELNGYLGNDKYDGEYCSDHKGIVFTLNLYLTITCVNV